MPDVQANGLQLRYETLGDPADPALLLVMGLGRSSSTGRRSSVSTWPGAASS